MKILLPFLLSLACCLPLSAQHAPIPYAHAHNDYQHKHPLRDAMKYGFCSVEADVFLIDGELYVAHVKPLKRPKITLKNLYLDPLNALVEKQKGYVYPGYEGVFYLMIDFKSNADSTYAVLSRQLAEYPALRNNPHIKIFISGNRPVQAVLQDKNRLAALDGRPADLEKLYAPAVMPVISDTYKKYFQWRGKGKMPDAEFAKLKQMADDAHAQGKKLRLWAIPDKPNAWKTLRAAGVDLINTDKLAKMSRW